MKRKQRTPTFSLPNSADKKYYVQHMFDTIAPRYQIMNTIITFGLDRYWRKKALSKLVIPENSLILDLASGPGELADLLGSRGHRMISLDISREMLLANRRNKTPKVQADCELLPFPEETFDTLVSAFGMRNFPDLSRAFAEVSRVVKPGGSVFFMDISQPRAVVFRSIHKFYFNNIVPLLGAVLSSKSAYKYLPESIAYLPSQYEIIKLLEQHNIENVSHTSYTFDTVQAFIGVRSRKHL